MSALRLFLSGDSIFQHPLETDPHPLRQAIAELAATSDLGLSNLECNIQTQLQAQVCGDWPAFVAGQGRGTTYMAAPPEVLADLKRLGIGAVFTANNHSTDFGESGILTTIRHLDAAGLGHAGTGASLAEATGGCVVDTTVGRVALIGASDWGPRGLTDLTFPWPMGVLAADADERFPARPGVNLLRYRADLHVDAAAIRELRRISEALGWERTKQIRNRGGGRSEPLYATSVFGQEVDDDQRFHFMGRRFVLADEFGFETVAFDEDIERNCEAVRRAREAADYVVVGVHQQGASRAETSPPDHAVQFAHAVIDAGADLFVAHGRARAGGVEIYRSRPVIYGVPGFVNHLDQVPFVPVEQKRRWGLADDDPASAFIARRREAESGNRTAIGIGAGGFLPMVVVLAELGLDGGRLEYYPFELVEDGADSELGEPRVAGADLADRTLAVVADRVRALGTSFELADGVGIVRYSARAAT